MSGQRFAFNWPRRAGHPETQPGDVSQWARGRPNLIRPAHQFRAKLNSELMTARDASVFASRATLRKQVSHPGARPRCPRSDNRRVLPRSIPRWPFLRTNPGEPISAVRPCATRRTLRRRRGQSPIATEFFLGVMSFRTFVHALGQFLSEEFISERGQLFRRAR